MAERLTRRALVDVRASRSPSPVAEPSFRRKPKMPINTADVGPLGLNWPVYRWTVRTLLVLCLFLCAVVYVFSHSASQDTAKTRAMGAVALGFAILVCMSKTWHRKRLPGFLLGPLLLLLISLTFYASDARKMHHDDLAEMHQLELKTLQEQQQAHDALQTMRILQAQLAQKEKEQQDMQRTVRSLQAQLRRKEEEERAKKFATAVRYVAWSLFHCYLVAG